MRKKGSFFGPWTGITPHSFRLEAMWGEKLKGKGIIMGCTFIEAGMLRKKTVPCQAKPGGLEREGEEKGKRVYRAIFRLRSMKKIRHFGIPGTGI